ncbi:hypothetical protein [Streptomyces sp. NPDC091209]|uniref:hypothetical protein n=1 Tax=Streptomyces sp. NPDC091209 TaxID=3365974 RepID=UPI0037F9A3D5
MKSDQDSERTPSRDAAAVKGRVTSVPAERSPDDRADENRGEAEEVSRREALKGRVDPASAEPAPGDPAGNGDGTAVRPTGTGTAPRETTGVDADEREAPHGDRTGRTAIGAAPATPGTSDRPGPRPVPRDTGEALPKGRSTAGSTDTKDRTAPAAATATAPATATEDRAGRDERMLPLDEYDKFSLRMRHAVGGFVDGPQASVEEADHVLEELAGRFTEAVTRRRRALRTSWQSGDEGKAAGSDTERLRLALRDYREMTERLLRL